MARYMPSHTIQIILLNKDNILFMENTKNEILGEPKREAEGFPILDSRLITTTISKKYDIKVVDCGEYIQVYYYENSKIIRHKKDNIDLELTKQKINNIFNEKNDLKETSNNNLKENKIEMKNIIRSKLTCQRIAKTNADKWKSFITLTFEENITNIKEANKKFNYFTNKVRRIKKDFSYIAIPEFQKRGAIHYHLLTNLECNSNLIPKRPKKRLYNPNTKRYKELEYYDLKYWNDGFSSAELMTGDIKKIVGYISKYMTKDVDNRLFGYRRFFYSQNLIMPKDNYIDINNVKEYEFYQKKVQDKEVIYQNEYINPYDGSLVTFLEFKS